AALQFSKKDPLEDVCFGSSKTASIPVDTLFAKGVPLREDWCCSHSQLVCHSSEQQQNPDEM
ncbi:hypothetical protein ACQP3F_33430, partial [Escherichia coli]